MSFSHNFLGGGCNAHLPDQFHLEPLEYGCKKQMPDLSTILMIGMIVYVFLQMNRPPQHRTYMPSPISALTTMIANSVGGVPTATKVNVRTLVADLPGDPGDDVRFQEIIDVAPKQRDTPASDSVKKTNEKCLRNWMANNKNACIVIFAWWCPHCKTLIKELVTSVNENGTKFLLVNGEAVSPNVFQGPNAVHNVQYYPTILCKLNDEYKVCNTLGEAGQLLDTAADDETEAVDEGTTTEDSTDDSTEENQLSEFGAVEDVEPNEVPTGEMLARLF